MSWSHTVSRRIDYRWECDAFGGEIPKPLLDLLKEHAEERIASMSQDGYTNGELVVNMTVELDGLVMPKGGWPCHGWWTIKGMD